MKTKLQDPQAVIKSFSAGRENERSLNNNYILIRARARQGTITVCHEESPERTIDLAKEIKSYGSTIAKVLTTLERSEAESFQMPALQEMTDRTPAEICINIDGVGIVYCKRKHVLHFTDEKSKRLGDIVKMFFTE